MSVDFLEYTVDRDPSGAESLIVCQGNADGFVTRLPVHPFA